MKPFIARKNVVITPSPATYPRLRNSDGSMTGLPDRRSRRPKSAKTTIELATMRMSTMASRAHGPDERVDQQT